MVETTNTPTSTLLRRILAGLWVAFLLLPVVALFLYLQASGHTIAGLVLAVAAAVTLILVPGFALLHRRQRVQTPEEAR